jgi:hypothetical protein
MAATTVASGGVVVVKTYWNEAAGEMVDVNDVPFHHSYHPVL